MDITPLARWDWIRWIGATRNPDTRIIRIEKTLSKLKSGKRAACRFNRSQCTDPSVSHNGLLLEPTTAGEHSRMRQATPPARHAGMAEANAIFGSAGRSPKSREAIDSLSVRGLDTTKDRGTQPVRKVL